MGGGKEERGGRMEKYNRVGGRGEKGRRLRDRVNWRKETGEEERGLNERGSSRRKRGGGS